MKNGILENINDVYTYGLRGTPRKIRMGVPRTTFLQKHYFGGAGGVVTAERVIELRIEKKGRPVAEQAEWNSKGHIVKRGEGFKQVFAPVPYFYDRVVITPEDFDTLDFEEDTANPLKPEEKMLLVLREAREKVYDIQDSALELMALEVLTKGGYTHKNAGFQSYGISDKMFVDGSTDSDGKLSAATSKLKWLQAKCQAVYEDSGRLVTEILMDINTLFALISDTEIKELLDNRDIEAGRLSFGAYREDGVAWHGKLMIPGFGGVDLLTYGGLYTDSEGTQTRIWEDKSMLFGAANLGNSNYGGIYENNNAYLMSHRTAAKDFVHVVDGDGDIPSNMAVCRQTAPVLAPMTIGGWLYVKNAI